MASNSGLILLVDDDEAMRISTQQWLNLAGFDVVVCASAEQALKHLGGGFPGILITDVRMPGMDGLALMRHALEADADLPVMLMTGHGDVAMAVQAMRDGAYDFIEKPYPPETLVDIVRRALEKRALVQENRSLRAELRLKTGIDVLLLGKSDAMAELRQTVTDLADTPANVLIRGETGTGKEQVARSLHAGGRRRQHPMVAINCAAMPETLFESELFGHEAGSFTGADQRRIGKLEYASKGSLFLDEIEDMPMNLQVKLLRVLQERQIERLGSNQLISVDLRVVAATKVDLLEKCRQKGFREDLYYRLNVAEIYIPPLRERREDIPLLFEHFCHAAALTYERQAPEPGRDDLRALMAHDWPGNVRELKNIAERYIIAAGGKNRSLAEILRYSSPQAERSLSEQLDTFEKVLLEQELARHNGAITATMESLDLPRRTLNEKMRKYNLTRKDFL